jgi:hypothetical protein
MKNPKSQLLLIYLSIILVSCSFYSKPSTPTPVSVESEIKQIFQNDACKPPCFLGIVPKQTTIGELKNMFTRYGETLQNDPCGYSNLKALPNSEKLIPNINFCVRDDKIVNSMLVDIYRNDFAWSFYSPANVIKRFGTPSKIIFGMQYIDDPTSTKGWYLMTYYYDDLDFMIRYGAPEVKLGELITVCPNKDEFAFSTLWLGEPPDNPPDPRIAPLEEVTSFTIESFREYILGAGACFDLKGKALGIF